MKYDSNYKAEERKDTFEATFLAVMEIICSHKTLSNIALLTPEPRYSKHSSLAQQALI